MLDLSTFLVPGHRYTFSFSPSTWTYISGEAFDVDGMDSALSTVANISGASAWSPAKLSGHVNVTFTYTGDGADVVAVIWQNIADAFENGFGGTFDYVGAEEGTTGAGTVTPTIPLPDVSGLFSSSGLWAIVVIAALGVFVFSGGAAATRRVLA